MSSSQMTMDQSPVARFRSFKTSGVSDQSIAYLGRGSDPPLAEELLRVWLQSYKAGRGREPSQESRCKGHF
jgi:hypothetical protein